MMFIGELILAVIGIYVFCIGACVFGILAHDMTDWICEQFRGKP